MTKAVSLARSVSDTGLLLDGDLAAIAALSGTTGLLKKDSANTWSLDTSSYLTGNQTLTFSGDATGTGTTAITITLVNSGVSAGSYGSATNIPAITVDSKGRITSVTNTAVSIPSGSLTFTGDVTGSGSTGSSTSLTLASVGTAGTYTKVTTDAKGRVTSGGTLASGDLPTYTGTLTSGQITTALGYTPENLANKAAANGYASLDSSGKVPTAQLSGFVDQTKPNIRPTLNLDFANSKIVDSRITFTRTTTASYYDLQGILKYAQPDEPRIDHDPSTGECRGLLIEEQRTNIMTYSANLKHTDWQTDGPGYGIQNYDIAPDGTQTAYRIAEGNTTSIQTRFIKSSPISTFSNTTFTFSMYVKSNGTKRNIFMLCQESGLAIYAHFDIVAGTIVQSSGNGGGTLSSAQILNIGKGWFRISISGLLSGATAIYPMIHLDAVGGTGFGAVSYTGDGSSGVYIWGVQFEAGAFATSYIPSTTTFTSRASSATYFDSTGILRLAGTNQPRYGYGYDTVSNKWVSQGLVLEAAATNYLNNSSVVYTSVSNASISRIAGPDGLPDSAIRVTYLSSGSAFLNNITSSINAGTYVFSVWMRLNTGSPSNGVYSYQGVGVGPSSNSWTTLASQLSTTSWTRVWAVFTYSGTGSVTIVFPGYDAGNGVIVDYYAPQFESGYVATSYIPTYGATATRAADVSSSAATTRSDDFANISGNNFSSWFNYMESTAFISYIPQGGLAFGRAFEFNNGSVANNLSIQPNGYQIRNPASVVTYSSVVATIGTTYNSAMVFKQGDYAFASQGSLLNTTTSGSHLIPTQLWIGSRGVSASATLNGTIKKITYYPKRLSNTELQALTQ